MRASPAVALSLNTRAHRQLCNSSEERKIKASKLVEGIRITSSNLHVLPPRHQNWRISPKPGNRDLHQV